MFTGVMLFHIRQLMPVALTGHILYMQPRHSRQGVLDVNKLLYVWRVGVKS